MKAWNFCLALRIGLVLLAHAVVGIVASSALRAAELPIVKGDVTFSKDIARILQRSCQNCHQPNSVAPMSLINYQQGRPWAKSTKEPPLLRDKRGVMPPWS